ncbi:MAG: histidine phosphatase family protein [Alphaproteobacteria bacterium]|nr:histidine phosphatase family protein [Alphaproteobacteria bacterium]
MKRLILLRHAEAQSPHIVKIDRERPVSGQGMKQMDVMGAKLHQKFLGVDYVLCSNARRARQTFEGLKKHLPLTVKVSFEDKLYGAPGNIIVDRLRRIEDSYNNVLVIAHNPGLQQFLNETTQRTPSKIVPKEFQTCSASFFNVDTTTWFSVDLSSFLLVDQILPTVE